MAVLVAEALFAEGDDATDGEAEGESEAAGDTEGDGDSEGSSDGVGAAIGEATADGASAVTVAWGAQPVAASTSAARPVVTTFRNRMNLQLSL